MKNLSEVKYIIPWSFICPKLAQMVEPRSEEPVI